MAYVAPEVYLKPYLNPNVGFGFRGRHGRGSGGEAGAGEVRHEVAACASSGEHRLCCPRQAWPIRSFRSRQHSPCLRFQYLPSLGLSLLPQIPIPSELIGSG